MLPRAAVGLAMIKCRENADRGVHAGHVVDDAGPDLHGAGAGLAVHVTGDAHQSAHRLEDRVVTGARRVRASLAEAGYRANDDAGADCPGGSVSEFVWLEVADLNILHP